MQSGSCISVGGQGAWCIQTRARPTLMKKTFSCGGRHPLSLQPLRQECPSGWREKFNAALQHSYAPPSTGMAVLVPPEERAVLAKF